MDWYDTLTLPSFTPDGSVIGAVWTVLYILIAISMIFTCRRLEGKKKESLVALYAINLTANALWTPIFFGEHRIDLALLTILVIDVTGIMLVWQLWKDNRTEAALLIPYVAWVLFATFLNASILTLNA